MRDTEKGMLNNKKIDFVNYYPNYYPGKKNDIKRNQLVQFAAIKGIYK
jgi:hypothetical protein